ncbi:hypothetical protein ACRALDRAFT_1095430 [Sodiomyces alcalophilus JCM 7366]|uniref:uncharacterized protein n=1 Tax=Sodiomyces alcalophilus JCM 7366 TaxID=591952 RepID=UPI0039B582D3
MVTLAATTPPFPQPHFVLHHYFAHTVESSTPISRRPLCLAKVKFHSMEESKRKQPHDGGDRPLKKSKVRATTSQAIGQFPSPRAQDSRTPAHKSKLARLSDRDAVLQVGDQGIWVTFARGMDGKAISELMGLSELILILSSIGYSSDPSEDEEQDIEASIEKELDGFKAGGPKKDNRVFKAIRADIDCVFFMKTREPIDPVTFCREICEDAESCPSLRERKTRYINRLTPVSVLDKATENGVERVARKVLAPWFELQGETEGDKAASGKPEDAKGPAYSVISLLSSLSNDGRQNSRKQSASDHNTELKHVELIQRIAALIDTRHKVNLEKPDKVILVDVFKVGASPLIPASFFFPLSPPVFQTKKPNERRKREKKSFCGMSVVDGNDWARLRKFNVNEVYKAGASRDTGKESTGSKVSRSEVQPQEGNGAGGSGIKTRTWLLTSYTLMGNWKCPLLVDPQQTPSGHSILRTSEVRITEVHPRIAWWNGPDAKPYCDNFDEDGVTAPYWSNWIGAYVGVDYPASTDSTAHRDVGTMHTKTASLPNGHSPGSLTIHQSSIFRVASGFANLPTSNFANFNPQLPTSYASVTFPQRRHSSHLRYHGALVGSDGRMAGTPPPYIHTAAFLNSSRFLQVKTDRTLAMLNDDASCFETLKATRRWCGTLPGSADVRIPSCCLVSYAYFLLALASSHSQCPGSRFIASYNSSSLYTSTDVLSLAKVTVVSDIGYASDIAIIQAPPHLLTMPRFVVQVRNIWSCLFVVLLTTKPAPAIHRCFAGVRANYSVNLFHPGRLQSWYRFTATSLTPPPTPFLDAVPGPSKFWIHIHPEVPSQPFPAFTRVLRRAKSIRISLLVCSIVGTPIAVDILSQAMLFEDQSTITVYCIVSRPSSHVAQFAEQILLQNTRVNYTLAHIDAFVGAIRLLSPNVMIFTTPPGHIVQAIMGHVLPDTCVQEVRSTRSQRHQTLYDVQSSDGTHFLVAFSSPRMARSLRSEQGSISSEAMVLSWLAALSGGSSQCSEGCTSTDTSKEISSQFAMAIPSLIAHLPLPNDTGVAYNITKPTPGLLITDLQPGLSPEERRGVDFQTGKLHRDICRLVSPTGRFGPAFDILPFPPHPHAEHSIPSACCAVHGSAARSDGVISWATAFHSMLEAVLRDGEDLAIMLGYSAIRGHLKRLKPVLDGVVSPRLVAVDVSSDINTLVVRETQSPESISPGSSQSAGREAEGPRSIQSDEDTTKESVGRCGRRACEDREASRLCAQCAVTVTGMKDWSNFIFGDPLFATVFSQGPSNEFLRGFSGLSDDATPGDPPSAMTLPPDLVEDEPGVPIRLLLYECYHTITQIVSAFYRPQSDSSQRELAARKRLNDNMTYNWWPIPNDSGSVKTTEDVRVAKLQGSM